MSQQRAALEQRVLGELGGALTWASWEQYRLLGAYLGLAFYAASKKRRVLGAANVQSALDVNATQAARITRRSAQNWGMTSCEFLHMPTVDAAALCDYVSLEGQEHLEAALALGKGAVILSAHMGNWELLGARIALDHPTSGVVRPISNATVQTHMSRVRRNLGMSIIDKYDAGRPTLKALRRNEVVCILADRHAGRHGLFLPLFGQLTSFESAPARMAMMGGAPIVPVVGARRGPWLAKGSIGGRFFPAFQVEAATRADREASVIEGTKQVIANLESLVREYPDQWTWMLRRWRSSDMRHMNMRHMNMRHMNMRHMKEPGNSEGS